MNAVGALKELIELHAGVEGKALKTQRGRGEEGVNAWVYSPPFPLSVVTCHEVGCACVCVCARSQYYIPERALISLFTPRRHMRHLIALLFLLDTTHTVFFSFENSLICCWD